MCHQNNNKLTIRLKKQKFYVPESVMAAMYTRGETFAV